MTTFLQSREQYRRTSVYQRSRVFTNAQIKTLPTFPAALQIVPTPGARWRIIPLHLELIRNFTTGYTLSDGQDARIRCIWGASDVFEATDSTQDNSLITGTGIFRCVLPPLAFASLADSVENKAMLLHDTQEGAAYSGGHVNNWMQATLTYLINPLL